MLQSSTRRMKSGMSSITTSHTQCTKQSQQQQFQGNCQEQLLTWMYYNKRGPPHRRYRGMSLGWLFHRDFLLDGVMKRWPDSNWFGGIRAVAQEMESQSGTRLFPLDVQCWVIWLFKGKPFFCSFLFCIWRLLLYFFVLGCGDTSKKVQGFGVLSRFASLL